MGFSVCCVSIYCTNHLSPVLVISVYALHLSCSSVFYQVSLVHKYVQKSKLRTRYGMDVLGRDVPRGVRRPAARQKANTSLGSTLLAADFDLDSIIETGPLCD